MRLTCPNCGAQYEVPDAVIPVSGRDVQCSNCGNTWFQHHADHAPDELESEPEAFVPEPDPASEADPESYPEREPEPDIEPESEPAPEPAPATQRRIDPGIAEILREEADRERAARASESGERLETQPDLGLDALALDERSQQSRTRMERLRGGTAQPAPVPETAPEDNTPQEIDPPSRRNLFPDIDEINSSLSANEDNGAPMPPPILPEEALPAPRKSGFRTGFRLAVLTCLIALVAYLMAPQIVALAPGLKDPVTQFVAAVDTLRGMLSQAVAGIVTGG